jgi:hypothetical protein
VGWFGVLPTRSRGRPPIPWFGMLPTGRPRKRAKLVDKIDEQTSEKPKPKLTQQLIPGVAPVAVPVASAPPTVPTVDLMDDDSDDRDESKHLTIKKRSKHYKSPIVLTGSE